MGEKDQRDRSLVAVESSQGSLIKTDDELEEVVRLKSELAARRAFVHQSFERLQDQIDESLDWQHWVRENPWTAAGLAFAVGFLWGSG